MKMYIPNNMPYYDKIKTKEQIRDIIKTNRNNGRVVVHTNGCFDIFHLGHLAYLYEASTYGELLVVGINSDKSVKKLKGNKRPIITEEERASIVAGMAYVDYVYIFDDDHPARMLEFLKPTVHVKGGDYTGKERTTKEWPVCEKYHIRFMTTNTYGNLNSTNKVRQILDTYDRQDVRRENVKNKRKED